jgi:outer membrane protein
MKKSIQTLFALATFGAAALLAQAQPAPKILVVDLAKVYDTHYKTEEQQAKLRADEQKAQEELDRLNKEGNDLVVKYKELAEQASSTVLAPEAKSKAQGEAQKMLEEIRRKQTDVQTFQQNTRNSLQQRIKTFAELLLEEISKVAVDVAKRKGATLLLDKTGRSLIGVPMILYADADYDITSDVMKEVNKDRPAASAAPATATSAPAASAPADAGSDSPKITLPGARKP